MALCLLLGGGCSTSAPPAVDLSPARKAVEEASGAARGEEARAAADRARQRLIQAEALASSPEAESRSRAVVLAELAVAEARCATLLERAAAVAPVPASPQGVPSAGAPS